MDENDRINHAAGQEHSRSLRHLNRKTSSDASAPIEVDSTAFFSETAQEPAAPAASAPSSVPPKHTAPPAPPKPPVSGHAEPEKITKRGAVLLVLQAVLSIAAMVQLWRTQMLPALYLIVLGALLVLLWLLVKRCQEYKTPGIVSRIFSLVLCAAMALGCVWAQQGLSALGSVTSGILTGAAANKITKEPFVVYLSGVDTRGELTEKARSDVNILAVVNPKTKQVALINTPRDYYVDLAGTDSKDKLTHAGLYGVENSMETLGNLYGIEADHYIRINFAGFMTIVDALGGVDVYSDQAFTSVGSPGYYDPTTFAEGWNHLDGQAALAFARERKAFATGDVQRGINQMKVIDAMLNKIKSPTLLMSFSRLMEAASDCFVTSFSQDQISALVRMQLSDFAEWSIESYTVTGTSAKSTQCYSAKGQSLYVMKPDTNSVNEAKALIAGVLGGEEMVSDTTQKPEKTEVYTPSSSTAPAPEEPAESEPEQPDEAEPELPGEEELPADSLPEELPSEQEGSSSSASSAPSQPEQSKPGEPSASSKPSEPDASTKLPEPEPEAPASSDTSSEKPAPSRPSREDMEDAASSIYNAASTLLDALWGGIGS